MNTVKFPKLEISISLNFSNLKFLFSKSIQFQYFLDFRNFNDLVLSYSKFQFWSENYYFGNEKFENEKSDQITTKIEYINIPLRISIGPPPHTPDTPDH